MGQIFNMENPFWRFMGKLVDIAILNVLWFICCIPIVTIGPSTTAVYYVTLKLVRDEEGYTVSNFFKSFKQNLKQGMIIGIIMTLFGGFILFDIYAFPRLMENGRYFAMAFIGIFVIYMFIVTYIYPLLSKFDNTVKQTFLNAVFMSIRHFVKTLLMIIIAVGMVAGCIFFPPLVILGFGMTAFLQSYLLVGIFDKYMPDEEKEQENEKQLEE